MKLRFFGLFSVILFSILFIGVSILNIGCPDKSVPSTPVTVVYLPATNTITFTPTNTGTPTITFTPSNTPTMTPTFTPCGSSSTHGNNDPSASITVVPFNTDNIVSNEITIPSTTSVTSFNIFYSGGNEVDYAIYSISGTTATLVSYSSYGFSGGSGGSWKSASYFNFPPPYPVLSVGNYLLVAYCPYGGNGIGVNSAACTSYTTTYQIPGTYCGSSCFANILQYWNTFYLNGSSGNYSTTAGTTCYEMNIVTCP